MALELRTCPACDRRVIPMKNGRCPHCREKSFPAADGQPAEAGDVEEALTESPAGEDGSTPRQPVSSQGDADEKSGNRLVHALRSVGEGVLVVVLMFAGIGVVVFLSNVLFPSQREEDLKGLTCSHVDSDTLIITEGFEYAANSVMTDSTGKRTRYRVTVHGITEEEDGGTSLEMSGEVPFFLRGNASDGTARVAPSVFRAGMTLEFEKAGLSFRNGEFRYTSRRPGAEIRFEPDWVELKGFSVARASSDEQEQEGADGGGGELYMSLVMIFIFVYLGSPWSRRYTATIPVVGDIVDILYLLHPIHWFGEKQDAG